MYDPAGKAVYPEVKVNCPYAVRVSISDLNIRKGPGTNYANSMTVVQWIGKMGYSIYLIHYIVFWKVAQYNPNVVVYVVASISITVVLSILSYYCVEQKLVR